ncbi:MAG: autotransporter outer membrane beta-barrel domain-containing protein [Caulobacter sp.]
MSTITRHSRLSASVSALALIVASPALAQAVVSPGLDVGPEFVVTADQVLTQGVTDTGSPAATAVVSSIATGTIVQRLSIEEAEPTIVVAAAPGGADAVISISNAGSVSIKALATAANAEGHAVANAQLTDAVTQVATTPNANASASLVNSGLFDLGATASATGTDFPGDVAARAQANATGGLHQEATVEGGGAGSASTSITNSGTILFNGAATASSVGDALARATAGEAIFMRGQANGGGDGITTTTFANSGILTAGASATATSSAGGATAESTLGGGEHGLFHIRTAANGAGDDSATVNFTNAASGRISTVATANADGMTYASANAVASSLLVTKTQSNGQDGGLSNANATNSGRIDMGATSTAMTHGEGGEAEANATIEAAIQQVAEAEGSPQVENRVAAVAFTNAASGVFNVTGSATATGDLVYAGSMLDSAVLQQSTTTGAASASFTNAGTFLAGSDASATGLSGTAEAGAVGVEQEVVGNTAQANFSNSGGFTVRSTAGVFGEDTGSAFAGSVGYTAFGDPLALTVANSGAFTVTSDAQAAGPATAGALGMGFYGTFDPTAVTEGEEGGGHGGTEGHGGPTNAGHGGGEEGPVVWEEEATNTISGSVTNSGALTVTASAVGVTAPDVMLALVAPGDLPLGASAIGMDFMSSSNTATLTNSGTLRVSALSNVGVASATGILVRDFPDSPIIAPEGSVFTIVNDGGTIIARESTDGGATWRHGLAIDSTQAPNTVAIRFLGASSVYGDIDISADDSITVAGGTTRLDGVINPGGELEGLLTIASGGTLHLLDPRLGNPSYSGPAGGYLDTFTMVAGSTLALDLPVSSSLAPSSRAALAAPIPVQAIVTNTANLAGTLRIHLSSPNGLFANAYSFDNIIDANTLNGRFSSVVSSTGSPLLALTAIYDNAANVDLMVARVGFGAVPGLTFNQSAVGDGIETVYDPALTGPFAGLLANLFLLDAASYPVALEQLTGAQTAGYLQAVRDSSQQLNNVIADQSSCVMSEAGFDACRNPTTGLRMWAAAGQNSASIDSDDNAPGYDNKHGFGLLGLDYVFGQTMVGGYAGFRNMEVEFDRQSGRIEADGWLLGLRAAYDRGDFYVRGHGSYAKLDGDSVRSISILSTTGIATGKPDTETFALYGEAGARFTVGETWLSPFVALDYASADLGAFTETGMPGANLAYSSQSDSQAALLAGFRWTGRLGPLVPEARVAYRHDLGDRAFDVTARFADAPAGSDFTVRSPATDRGSVLAGLSLSGAFSDRVSGRLGYAGRFGGGQDDQAVYGSLTITFGGK